MIATNATLPFSVLNRVSFSDERLSDAVAHLPPGNYRVCVFQIHKDPGKHSRLRVELLVAGSDRVLHTEQLSGPNDWNIGDELTAEVIQERASKS